MVATSDGGDTAAAAALLAGVGALARERGRPDLADRVDAARTELDRPLVHVVVAGEYKRGKSALVNALVGADATPVDVDLATAVPVVVSHAATAQASVVMAPADDEEAAAAQGIDPGAVAEWASEAGNPGNERAVQAVQVGLPAPLLGTGVSLVDTPGVGGLTSVHAEATLAAVALADAVLFVTDAAEELTAPELAFLRRAAGGGTPVACVVAKTDFYPEWRAVVERDRAHLAAAGVDAEVFPTSAALRALAVRRGDPALDEESGYPALLAHLAALAGSEAAARRRRRAAAEALAALAQLESALRAEEEGLAGGARADAVVSELTGAPERARAELLRAGGWQDVLADGFRDLQADVDEDLADRLRAVAREAEAAVEAADPAEAWDELVGLVERQAAAAAAASRGVMAEGVAEVAGRVADRYGAAETTVTASVTVASSMIEAVALARRLGAGNPGAAVQGMIALQGSWAGVEALGMVGGLVGVGMLNPVALVIGLFLGRRALREERERRVQGRRAQAREAIGRYLDEVEFRARRDCHRSLRRAQKRLREAFSARAAELERTLAEALTGARRAAEDPDPEAERAAVAAALDRVAGLRAEALALEGGGG